MSREKHGESEMYKVTKTYGHDLGLSCCFRQHRADSHCAKLHGYAIAVKLEFTSSSLDERNWVIDFGALKPVKEYLVSTFDHTTIVAQDDPALEAFQEMNDTGLIDLRVMPNVGCEAFAEAIFNHVRTWLFTMKFGESKTIDAPVFAFRNLNLASVEVREHGANAASYYGIEV